MLKTALFTFLINRKNPIGSIDEKSNERERGLVIRECVELFF